jgi:hypothetical protein
MGDGTRGRVRRAQSLYTHHRGVVIRTRVKNNGARGDARAKGRARTGKILSEPLDIGTVPTFILIHAKRRSEPDLSTIFLVGRRYCLRAARMRESEEG